MFAWVIATVPDHILGGKKKIPTFTLKSLKAETSEHTKSA